MADNVIDYGQHGVTSGGYKTPTTTTKTTKTTTKEFDNKGTVVKEVIVEETVTETMDYYSPGYTFNVSNTGTPGDIKFGNRAV